MDSIIDTNYKHAKIVLEDFGLQNQRQCYDLHVQSDAL